MADTMRILYEGQKGSIRVVLRQIDRDGAAPSFDLDATIEGLPLLNKAMPEKDAAMVEARELFKVLTESDQLGKTR